ncbi:MAG: helix-turn-helix transcriptional regulator [Steroidobacteraceae bacterium]
MTIPRLTRWQAGALGLGAVLLLLGLEVVDEQELDWLSLGLEVVEISLIVTASLATLIALTRVEDQERTQQEILRELTLARQEGAQWRSRVHDLMRGLGGAIDQQFDRWELSPAEKDVALLLLKGFSHKEAAELRGRAERTIRQQALAVYRKAKLSGRASLAAYFLEDLLLPSSTDPL